MIAPDYDVHRQQIAAERKPNKTMVPDGLIWPTRLTATPTQRMTGSVRHIHRSNAAV